MGSLPKRFPRASLIQAAAALESRINKLMEETNALIEESEDRGMAVVTRKLSQRYNALDQARAAVNDARIALWDLP